MQPTDRFQVPPTLRATAMILLIVMLAAFSQSGRAGENASPNPNKTPPAGGDFTLTDHNGQPFSLASQRGKLVLIFFGYTFCPDICPTELATLSRLLHSLDRDADKVTALFITVDPERDTAAKLKQYVPFYSKRLIGLTGSRQAIDQVTRAYHVQYRIHPHKPSDRHYLVDHSASLYVVSPEGKLTQIIPFGLPYEHIENVVRQQLSRAR